MAHRRPVPYTPAELRAMMSGAGHIAGSLLSPQELEAQAAAQRILESG
jgi:5-methylcytosine-specific restriction protein A